MKRQVTNVLLLSAVIVYLHGTPALAEFILASTYNRSEVQMYDTVTKQTVSNFISGSPLGLARGLAYGPDGNLYVADVTNSQILRYNASTGAFIDVYVASDAASGLNRPVGIEFGPDGNLYVSNQYGNNVTRYNGQTGAYMGVFTSGYQLNVSMPIHFGPDGNLYVGNIASKSIIRYNGQTGAFMDVFVSCDNTVYPYNFSFGHDGNLYILNRANFGSVIRYNGQTGALIDTLTDRDKVRNTGGTELNFTLPYGMLLDAEGRYLYVGTSSDGIVKIDATNGNYVDRFGPKDINLEATYMIFTPEPGTFLLLSLGGAVVLRRRRGF